MEITIKYLKKSKYISHIVISTDDKKMSEIASKYKCFVIFPRPKKLSNDNATSEMALKHALNIYEKKFGKVDITAYTQVTEPNKPVGIMDKCIEKLIKNKKIDSCFAAYKQQKNFWIQEKGFLKRISPFEERYKPRQKKKSVFREDTGIALATRSKYIRKGERIGKVVKCITYDNPFFNIDINNYNDLKFAKKILK